MERHMRLSRAAVVLVAIALIASIAAAVWFASPDAPYVPSEDSGAALGAAAPAEDGTVAGGYQPIGTGISSMDPTRSDTGGDFYLTQDIEITSLHSDDKWDQEFSGTFDGNGHTITINASHTTSCNDAGGMFIGLAAGAVIKNLTIVVQGFSLGFSVDTINAGMIAGYAAGGNITIDNVKLVLERTSGVNDPYVYKNNEGTTNTTINFGGLIGKIEDGTVTISNTTVINNEKGTYGFSARNWVREGSDAWIGGYDSKSWTNVGGFVGSVQANDKGSKGNLTMECVKYDAEDGAKMSAYAAASGGTKRYNYARLSPFLGVLNEGKLTVDNLIFNAGGTFTQMFYRDGSTTNEHDEGMYNGRGILIGYDVYKWLQEPEGVSSRKDVYLRNAITGDSGTGLGNGDAHTSLLAGNNSWLDGFMSYPSEIEDASFTDDGKIAFALPNRSGDIANAVSKINQNGTVTALTDTQIAEQVTEGGGLTWIEAPVVAHGDDTSVSASLNKVSTGTYNVQNYDAVSSAGDSAYLGSKVYDKTPVATPTLNVGGATVNAWTADSTSTTADAGTKTFSYNESALSGYAAAAYNGGTYLVKGGTIYSPGTIIVNGVGQTFALGKNFVYEITKAPVTVTPKVPTDLYAGNPMPELTATAVDSGGKAVEGSIEWDDPDATLVSGKHSYNWTWKPRSNNYQTVNGSMELEAFDKEIVKLTIDGEFKTDYVAYDAFDSTGIEVTATYSDDTTAVLTDEYAFKIVGADGNEVEGGIDKLFVTYNEVTVYLLSGSEATATISIDVDYVRFAVEQKADNKNITYGDSYQWNAADFYTWSDNTEVVDTYMDFYEVGPGLTDDISGIATADAETKFFGRVLGRAFYKGEEVPEAEYDNFIGINNPDEIASEVTLTIVPREVEIESKGIVSGTYSGEPVDLRMLFTAQSVNDDVIDLSFDITLNNETCDEVRGAGTYSVTASLASTETNYTAKPVTITYTVTKLAIPKPQDAEEPIVYDGKVHDVTPTVPEYKVVDGTTKETNAGNYSFTIALADKANTVWADGTDNDVTVTWSITPATVKITGEDSSKTYDGQAVNPKELFTAPNGVDGQPIELTVTVDGGKTILNAGTYTVTAKPTSANYAGACEVKYIINKADPTVAPTADVQGTLFTSDDLYKIALNLGEGNTPGTVSWDKGQRLTAGEQDYKWTFVPTDEVNYNGATGFIRLTAEQAQLDSVTVDVMPNTAYTAFDAFDPSEMVVTAHYENGDTKQVAPGDLSLTVDQGSINRLVVASTTVTVSYSDGDVTKSTTVTIEVSPLEVAAPTAKEDLVYNGAQQIGVEKTEQYTLTGNTAQDAGDYVATATLSDKDNTVWAGRDSADDVTIPWSIDHVTIEVTVNAESKTVEYGTEYSWDPHDFFAVEVTNSDLFEVKLGVFADDSITDISTANVGVYSESIYATVYNKDGGALEEQDLNSFKFSQDITRLAMKVIVTAKTVEVALDENVDFAAYDGEKLSEEELFGMFKTEMNIEDLAFEVDGVPYDEAEIVNAGEYTIMVSANGNYNLTGTTEGVYKIAKATLTVTASVESEGLDTSDDLYAVPLINVKGVGVNGEEVSGTGVWASGQSLSAGTNIYKFVFTPDQEFAVNYEVCEGKCEIANVAQATLTGVSVEIVETKEYVAFDAFDRSSIIVEALYGEDRKQVTDYTLTFSIGAEAKLFAGTGITVTVTYTDGDVKQSTEFTIDVAKRAVAKPVVDTTVFDATGETITLPIAESEYYTIYGNTATEPDRYVATVELKDKVNTMWEDGSTDDVLISWTITEPVSADEVVAAIMAMDGVTWQNAEEFLDLEARYNALDESEKTAEATAKLAVLRAQYDALRNAAFDDIEAAHEVTAKSLGKALAAAAAGLSAAAIALAIAKRRSI